MNIKFGLACLLLVATAAVATADECDFSVSLLTRGWGGERTAAMACIEAVPARAGENANTTAAIRQVFKGYSFSDLVTAGVAPYNLAVDWSTELDRIESAPYISDYSIHNDLGKLFTSLADAHLVYYKPTGYLYMRYYFPFSFVTRYEGGQQKFYAAPGPVNSATWNAICGCTANLPSYYGSEITKIDNVDIKDWLLAYAQKGGTYVDPGVQMNNILIAFTRGFTLGVYEAPASSSITYTFNGTTDASFNYHFQYAHQPNSVADVEGYNHMTSRVTRGVDGFGQNGLAESERLAIERLENAIRSKLSSRDSTSLRLLKTAKNHAGALKLTQKASTAFGVKLTTAQSKRDFNMEQFLASNKIPLAHERLSAIESAIVAAMDLEAGFDRETSHAETLRIIDDSIAQAGESVYTTHKKNAAAATETPLVTGDLQRFRVLTNFTNAGVGVYNDSIVLKLKGFSISDDGDFIVALKQAHALRSTYNTEQLIIDVSGNGGGIVCLNYVTLSFLVEQWRNHSLLGSDVLYSPYDWRITPLSDVFWSRARTDFGGEVDPATGAPLGNSVHDDPRTITYGSRTSQYTKLFNWDLCPDNYFEPETVAQVRAFDKIIILTDGTCGSSCAYFLSHLRSTNKVRVVSYGGATGLPLATSSFAGGNVLQYDAAVKSAIEGGYAGAANLTYMDHNAYTSFNFRSNYHTDGTLPRQFIREEADWHVNYWDPLDLDVYLDPNYYDVSESSFQTMANLYASVTPLFQQMPTGLSRIDLPPSAPTAGPVDAGSASGVSPLFVAYAFLVLLFALIF